MRLDRTFFKAKYNITFENNDVFKIGAKDLRELVTDLTDSFGDAQSAQFVAQKNGKTSFWLGDNLRDIKKIALRKFSKGTLPAILPAPVPAADRPVGVAAPGSAFPLSGFISGPATGPAAIAEYTRMVEDGNHFVVAGSDLDQAAYPVYQNGNFYATTVSSQDAATAAVRLPRVGAAWDAALAWPSTARGIGVPVLLNVARVKWEQDVWAPGLTINIFGENLAQGNVEQGAGYVAIRQNGGPIRVYNTRAANPYRAPFTVPSTVVPGNLEYWYHNGHGGDFGWSAKRTVTVVAVADHVLTHDFGQRTRAVLLDATDASLNVSRIRDAYQALAQLGGGTLSTPAGSFPLNDTIQPKDRVRWICDSVATGGVTTLTAAAWVGTGNLGMFGSNFWICGATDGVEFIKTSGVKLADAEAVVVLNNLDQVQLRRTKARWNEPYDTRAAGPVREAVPAQPLRLGTSKNVFFDDCANTGSGINLGGSSNVFFTNYTHRATHNADYMLYSNNMLGWCMIGYDLRDLDPNSTDGANRGIRCIKSGGQNGRNRFRHLEKGVGTDLGIVRSGTNQAPDDNQFEQDLDEYNKTVYTDKVVSATANTVTVPRTLIVQVNNQPVSLVKPTEHLVTIVAGRGVGQWRGIVSTTIDTITVDEPWLVVPDATSVLHTGWFSTDSTRYDVHYTAKPDNAQNPLYNHSSFYNGFGGVRGGIIDKCSGDGFRQGISFVATQHDATMVDQTAFNVVRNSSFPNSRWGRRFEAMPGQTGWAFDVPGLYCNLLSNCTYEAAIVAKLVYQLPRDTAGQVANITMLVEENQPVDVGLNDFSPSFYNDPLYPPKAVVPGTLTSSRQLVQQAQVLLGATGTVLVAGGELGPLEPLPAGAGLDPQTGMLSYPDAAAEEAVLVFVDGTQFAPLARTAPASAGGGGTPTPAPGYTAGDGIDITGQVISATGYTDQDIDTLLAAKPVYTAGTGISITNNIISAPGASALASPIVAVTSSNTLRGYQAFDNALVTGNVSLILNTNSVTVTTNNRYFPAYLDARGSYVNVAANIELQLAPPIDRVNCYLVNAYFGGTGKLVMTSSTSTSPATIDRAAMLVNCTSTIELALDTGNRLLALYNCSFPAITGTGTVYLFGNTAYPTTVGTGVTIVDRRPGAGSGAGNDTILPVTATRTADYTLALADAGCLVPLDSASAVTVTVPDHATVPFPVGTTLYVAQDGAGDVTIAGASGVVVQKADGYKVGGQWLDVALHKRDLNRWVLKGGVQ